MWNGKSYKGNRSTECCDDSRKYSCNDEQGIAHYHDIHAQILCVFIAKQKCIEWFYQQHGHHDADNGHCGKYRHLLHCHTTEVTQTPYQIGFHSLFCGKEIE